MPIEIMDGLSEAESEHEWRMMLDAGYDDLCSLPDAPDRLPERIAAACDLVRSACEGLGEPTDWIEEMRGRLEQAAVMDSPSARGALIRDVLDHYDIRRPGFEVIASVPLARVH